MESDIGEIFGTLAATRLARRRLSNRQLEEEARINEMPPNPGHEKNLSEHVPSSLIPMQDRVRALAVGGAPAWSRRLKRIYDLTALLTVQLQGEWHLAARAARGDRARFLDAWRRHAARFDFEQLNDLIANHNRYFPIEANLAMDVKTLDYVAFAGADYRRQKLDVAWILGQFPPELDTALVSAPPAGTDRKTR
jgi:hypothetical protein